MLIDMSLLEAKWGLDFRSQSSEPISSLYENLGRFLCKQDNVRHTLHNPAIYETVISYSLPLTRTPSPLPSTALLRRLVFRSQEGIHIHAVDLNWAVRHILDRVVNAG